jgi:hypothetical protein
MPTILATWVHKAEAEGSQASIILNNIARHGLKKNWGGWGMALVVEYLSPDPSITKKRLFFFLKKNGSRPVKI